MNYVKSTFENRGTNDEAIKWWHSMTHSEQFNMLGKHEFSIDNSETINIMWTKEHGNYPR